MADYFLSSGFSVFSVPAGMPPAKVSLISKDNEVIFSNEYYTPNAFDIPNLGSVIRNWMRAKELTFAQFTISASRKDIISGSTLNLINESFHVIYSNTKISGSDKQFLQDNFLLQSNIVTLPVDTHFPPRIPVFSSVPIVCNIKCFKDSSQNPAFSVDKQIKAFGDFAEIPSAWLEEHDSPCVISLKCGIRVAYFTFLTPDSLSAINDTLFRFSNNFNAIEYIALRGVLSAVPEADFQLVSVNGSTKAIDRVCRQSLTLSASNLTTQQALRAAALLYSDSVQIAVREPDSSLSFHNIIIDSVDGDFNDSDTNLCSVKISFSVPSHPTLFPPTVTNLCS